MNTTPKAISKKRVFDIFSLMLAPTLAYAQPVPSSPTPESAAEEDMIVLSPFEVSAKSDAGYTATETLGGTRVRTNLSDLASPLSVVTEKFLRDTGAFNNQTLLQYTTNTEVGGSKGNYSGLNGSASESSSLVNPNTATRVRGLNSADNTRNFFLSDIPWDGYNIDRVEIQRGPNSILFGLGSPAGIINNNTIVANLNKSSGKAEFVTDNFASLRYSLDYNRVIAKGLLAIRVAALDSKSKFRQEQAYNKDERLFATATFSPQLFDKGRASPLTIRANVETGKIDARNPRILPPTDALSNWFANTFNFEVQQTENRK